MNRKKSLFFDSCSFQNSSDKKNKTKNQKNDSFIDLTLSDDEDNSKELTLSNNLVSKKLTKKRKLNSKSSNSFTYESDDDELSDDIFSSLPLTQDLEFKNLNEKVLKRKNMKFSIDKEINIPKKKRKEYKLSNVQNSINWYFNNSQNKVNNNLTEKSTEEVESQLWIDKFIPHNSSELAVHKNKIEEVRRWLMFNIVNNRRKKPSLLILNGPSGSGKTATLKVLAEELDIEIVEWTNPINTLKISEIDENLNIKYDSMYKKNMNDYINTTITEKFKQFFMSANKYPSLQFEIGSKPNSTIVDNYSSQSDIFSSNSSSNNIRNYKYKVMLLEDVPLLSNLKTRKIFHSLIQSYFNSPYSAYSLVFIISEILSIDDDFLKKQEFSIKTYIPTSVLDSEICHIINFNPIAETFIAKALNNISTKALPTSKQLDNTILRAIGLHTNGDIRAAINTFQFLYLYDNPKLFLTNKDKFLILKEMKTIKDSKFRKKGAYSLLSNISSMNHHLSLFHIIGKILYNKRLSQFNNSNIAKIKYKNDAETFRYNFEFTVPEHLKEQERLRLEDEPDEIISQNQIDPSILLLFLEQNIHGFFEEIEELDDAFKYINIADQMQNKWRRNNKDFSLYSQYITMYGLLHSHTNPIPRSKRINKLYKPEEWSINKVIQNNNAQFNDILIQWSDTSNNNLSKAPIRIGNKK
ncbi:P-loop containing nucleoside triphosphate hydrolase protein [Piromyces finnis]|uniref:p-loop containing nucleoside triphosphate hydrolase protein n=1 Tax=Piromyces finnis TaxID=1754191 RepID=A0A1Y1V999_9FUNG|nr:P-loop containing nucleoside triphosphate hydrolase protein [Piromyces finnis]|eukprot:ORX50311.1 P-loop containing nucleoside triphosphate hydrolase protein [Piromyces finnis]